MRIKLSNFMRETAGGEGGMEKAFRAQCLVISILPCDLL